MYLHSEIFWFYEKQSKEVNEFGGISVLLQGKSDGRSTSEKKKKKEKNVRKKEQREKRWTDDNERRKKVRSEKVKDGK